MEQTDAMIAEGEPESAIYKHFRVTFRSDNIG